MYERKVVARATFDEASRHARCRGRAAGRGAGRARVGPRGRVAYTEVRAPYDGSSTAGACSPARPSPRHAVADGRILRRVARRRRSAAERRTGRACGRQGNRSIGRRRASPSDRVTLFPSAEPASSTFRARVELPTSVTGSRARHVREGRLRHGRVEAAAGAATAPWSSAANCARSTSSVRRSRGICARCASAGAVDEHVEVIAGLAEGERIATDPAVAGARGTTGRGPRT